jgi:very-short-patch-repair endonuclease
MDATSSQPTSTTAKLEASRRNLLDTSRRNKLINYKASRTVGVDVIGEDPFEVFNSLVVLGRTLTFTGKPEPKPQPSLQSQPAGQQTLYVNDYGDDASLQRLREKAEQELNSYLGYEETPVNQSDMFLNTNETAARLNIRLLKTLRDARTIVEESGVNVLFLALGMLEWHEIEDSKLVRRAPLILVPVALEQKHDKFKIRWDGGEIGCNLSLIALARQDFNVALPDFTNGTEMDVRAYLHQVSQAILTKPEWKVDTTGVALGFFSYAKFLMYIDLDAATWPHDRSPVDHPILNALLETGFENREPAIPDGEIIDPHRPLELCNEVTSIDGSQTLALMQAAQGDSMVVQGPPGTGKSQTITNLLADAVAHGKRVLFVAEKLAALDVVARKMEEVGLRDACLELHSHKANKSAFYKELDRILTLGPPRLEDLTSKMEMLDKERGVLNSYCLSANLPFAVRDISPRSCMGRLIQLGPQSDGLRIPPFEMMKGWSQKDYEAKRQTVRELQRLVHLDGCPSENPFYGSQLQLLIPGDRERLMTQVAEARVTTAAAYGLAAKLAEDLSVPAPATLAEVASLVKVAQRALEAPPMDGVAVKVETWTTNEQQLRDLIQSGSELKQMVGKNQFRVRADAWREEIDEHKAVLSKKGGKMLSGLNGAVRKARAFADHLVDKPPLNDSERIAICKEIQDAQEKRAAIQEGEAIAARLFGVQWQGERSDWESLSHLLEWIVALYASVKSGEIPRGLLDFLEGRDGLQDLTQRAKEIIETAKRGAAQLSAVIQAMQITADAERERLGTFQKIEETLSKWIEDPSKLQRLITFNNLRKEADEMGLAPISDLVAAWSGAGANLVESYDRCWYEGVLREGIPTRQELVNFDRARHESLVEDFKHLDDLLLQHNRLRIQRIHANGVPNMMDVGNLGWLNKEMKKKRSQASIRQAMRTAGAAIQDIKPVFMMSPLSVAMYLPADGPKFDLVIFDEASQIKPEDAFGAILRGSQAIVVGDTKQMPPTSFFDRLTSEVEDEDEEQAAANVTRDLESILALMDARIPPRSAAKRDLRWHYRSKHHSLIEPANAMSYDHRLFVFPNPAGPDNRLGLRFHHNPNTVYGRGTSRQNPLEAQDVVTAVQRHARENPDQSLMVVAFSASQQRAIQDELDRITPNDPAILEFLTRHPTERLDVKNLENVQGDERDVVFISVGYGKDDKGFAAMSFGPLLMDGGERRLNVLITRAKLRCEVFTNLTAADIRVAESQSVGLRHLKTFLEYAETGRLDSPMPSGLEPMSPFEEVVLSGLQGLGYEVHTQVGSAGFFIDLAVVDPAKPGSYIIGIECDGAQYHSSKTARDRDKLRQAVLEERGWTLHRIWSTDWYHDPKEALARCAAAIEQAKVHQPAVDPEPASATPTAVVEREIKKPPILQILPPYKLSPILISGGTIALNAFSTQQFAELVIEIVQVEAPIHTEEIMRRFRDAAALKSIGPKLRDSIFEGISLAHKMGKVDINGAFVYIPDAEIVLKTRNGLKGKNLDYVSDEEIAKAMKQVADKAYGANEADLATLTARLLGFDRTTATMQMRLNSVMKGLIANGDLTLKEGGAVSAK